MEVYLNLKHFHMLRNGTREPANQQGTATSRMQCVASEILVRRFWRTGVGRIATAREPPLQTPTIREKLANEGSGREENQLPRLEHKRIK